mgnify:CR=1 FL=1
MISTSASTERFTNGGIRPLVGRDMICFSHDWTGDPLSKTHLMRLLARDNRILWVNSIGYRTPTASKRDLGRIVSKLKSAMDPLREVEKNIFVLNPLAIPAWDATQRIHIFGHNPWIELHAALAVFSYGCLLYTSDAADE